MTKAEIEDFIVKQQRVSQRNYQHYQESGVARYYTAYSRAEKMIDIARQALESADDHQANGMYRSYISIWGSKAIEVLHERALDSEEAVQLLKDIRATVLMLKLARDPWEG